MFNQYFQNLFVVMEVEQIIFQQSGPVFFEYCFELFERSIKLFLPLVLQKAPKVLSIVFERQFKKPFNIEDDPDHQGWKIEIVG